MLESPMRQPLEKTAIACLLGACWVLSAATTRAEEKPAEKPPEKAVEEKPVRGPAENLVIEAVGGYGIGTLTTIPNHDPTVVHGPLYHVGVGYAWTIRASNSLGVEIFADGMVDSDRTTAAGAKVAGRYGLAAFMIGEKAHVRLGFGYTTTTAGTSTKNGAIPRSEEFTGLGLSFGLGYHFMVGKQSGWKRAAVCWEVVPSWDFLSGDASSTMHRLAFGMALGVGIY